MYRNIFFVALFWFALFASVQSGASEIHKWVDEDGVVHFGEKAPDNVRSEQVHLDEGPRPSPLPRSKTGTRKALPSRRTTTSAEGSGVANNSDGESGDLHITKRCEDAAQQLSVLGVALPTYRDQMGGFHNTATWLWDPYEGVRVYLDDASRTKEITKKGDEVRVLCASSGQSPLELEALGTNLRLRSEKCKIATVELERALDPRFSETQQEVRDKSRLVNEYCPQ